MPNKPIVGAGADDYVVGAWQGSRRFRMDGPASLMTGPGSVAAESGRKLEQADLTAASLRTASSEDLSNISEANASPDWSNNPKLVFCNRRAAGCRHCVKILNAGSTRLEIQFFCISKAAYAMYATFQKHVIVLS